MTATRSFLVRAWRRGRKMPLAQPLNGRVVSRVLCCKSSGKTGGAGKESRSVPALTDWLLITPKISLGKRYPHVQVFVCGRVCEHITEVSSPELSPPLFG